MRGHGTRVNSHSRRTNQSPHAHWPSLARAQCDSVLRGMNTEAPIIVVGAGIVGTATARALQRAGHAVTLLDSAEPGKATSYGNAGYLSVDSLIPMARPSTLKKVPKMLMDRDGPLTAASAQHSRAAALDGALRAGRR